MEPVREFDWNANLMSEPSLLLAPYLRGMAKRACSESDHCRGGDELELCLGHRQSLAAAKYKVVTVKYKYENTHTDPDP